MLKSRLAKIYTLPFRLLKFVFDYALKSIDNKAVLIYIAENKQYRCMKSLLELKEGEFAFVVDYTANEEIEQLFDMGIFPGEKIVMKSNEDKKDYILIQLNKIQLMLAKSKAETIITNYISFEFCLN